MSRRRYEKSSLPEMFQAIMDHAAGKLYTHANLWIPVGHRLDVPKKRITNPSRPDGFFSSDGTAVLVHGTSVRCPHPPTEGLFQIRQAVPASDTTKERAALWCVPKQFCKDCQYYRPANNNYKFPRCAYGLSEVDRAKKFVKDVEGMFEEAEKRSLEILGGAE